MNPATESSLRHLAGLQHAEGDWHGDYSGPMFLLPTYMIAMYAGQLKVPASVKAGMQAYMLDHMNADGGVGLHRQDESRLYTSVLTYVALRLSGISKDTGPMPDLCQWIHDHGGPLHMAPWGKFTLALVDLYAYDGIVPVPPELWLLPQKIPFHPGNMWVHSRMIFLPMAYLYGLRARRSASALVRQIRAEIFDENWQEIDWRGTRLAVADCDDLVPISDSYRRLAKMLVLAEDKVLQHLSIRNKAMATVLQQIEYEDRNTNSICIGPVNKVFNTLVWAFARPDGAEVRAHMEQMPAYFEHDGPYVKFNGYNSTSLWDTAFAVQALCSPSEPLNKEHGAILRKAGQWILDNQVVQEAPFAEVSGRAPSVGGWPFSTRAHGWPITDCTAEAIKALLALDATGTMPLQPDSQSAIHAGIAWILSLQNSDGSWATYEKTRGPHWLESLNPSAVWEGIMVDYGYVECTSACIQALSAASLRLPTLQTSSLQAAITRAARWIRKKQNLDGSWYGSWGICYTYGTWFGVQGLLAAGSSPSDPAIRRAVDFLLQHQQVDGGWGEAPATSYRQTYIGTRESLPVMTSWALLTLLAAGEQDTPAVYRAEQFLLQKVDKDGVFTQKEISGMFNYTTAIHYDNYRHIFPAWALGRLSAGRAGEHQQVEEVA